MPHDVPALELPADINRIAVPTPFAVGPVGVYVLDGPPLTLVDAGPATDAALSELEAGLAALGRRVEDVELLLLTHQHLDHVGLAPEVRRRSGATVAALAPLAHQLEDFELAMERDDRFAAETMRRHGVEEPVIDALAGMSRALRGLGGSVPVDRPLAHGDELDVGRRRFEVVHASGHSPTDTLFLDRADRLLVAGDHLLEHVSSNAIAHLPLGAEDPEAAARAPDRRRALEDYLASMGRTAGLDVHLVLPGHGDPFTGHRALVERRRRMHKRRAATIARHLDGHASAIDVARRFWRRMSVTQTYLALSEVLGHADLLESEGRIVAVEKDGAVVYAPSAAA